MKKIIAMLLTVILSFSFSPLYVKATETNSITSENNSKLWERFLKYDLCILDYDSLDDEQKDLCKFIFETELNSDDTIICERARRILNGVKNTKNTANFKKNIRFFNFLFFYCKNSR